MPPEPQDQVETPAPEDLRSQISAAFEAHEAPDDGEATVREGRPREPDGRFAKVEREAPTEPVAEEATSTEAAPVAPVEDKPAAPAPIEPPDRWSQADREAFKKIPVEAQDFVMRRYRDIEADYTRKTQEIAAFRRDYEPVQQMMAPFEQQIRNAGFTPATLIQAWAKVEQDLTQGRGVAVVKDLVQNYRLDRAQLARELGLTAPAAGVEQPPAPDGVAPAQLPPEVTQTLQQLQARQTQFDQYLTTQQQTRQREETNRVMSTITAFRDAKDPSGNLLHPHYDDLETDMIAYLQAARNMGQEPGLDELYEKAVYANPSTREKVLLSQRAAEEAQRTAAAEKLRVEARAKAEKARRAGSSVTGAPGASQAAIAAAKAGSGSLRDQIRASMEALDS